MRITTNVIRTLVGLLFIISGLVKANDPSGLGYKMEEFFEVWNASLSNSHFFGSNGLINLFSFLHEHALVLSIAMIVLEIMAGLALLLGWSKRFVLNLLLVLIIFFTFLTGYAFASGKFKNCGCFGDCLPISPLTSFLKDILLLVLIIWLLVFRRYIQPVGTSLLRMAVMIIGLIACLLFQWYVLNYLPVKDCLPFKKGNNITEQMKIPAGAVPDSFAIRFVYDKNGKQYEFSPTDLPNDLGTYKFISRTDKLIRKGNAEPPIKAFSLISVSNEDETQGLLNDPNFAIWYFINPDAKSLTQWKKNASLIQKASEKGIPVYIITSDADNIQKNITGFPIYKIDVTAFRTAARTNPCILLMKGGTIVNKWSSYSYSAAMNKVDQLPKQNG